ncbi:MAG: hypothetical protein IJ458_01515 [Clostridia bacterium]|nr:hypothetical protein [Clostridia bacterium]
MDFFKNIWSKIKNPHGIKLALFYVFFALIVTSTLVLVILVQKQTVLHYILYGVSGLSLVYFVYTMVIFVPKMKVGIINFLQRHKFTNAILKDYGYRTIVFGFCSLIINVAFISLVAVMAFMSKTAWYFTLTIYYIILAFMKGNVFYSKRKYGTEVKQARALRFSGIMFILMTIAFSGVIVLIYKTNRYFEYAGLLIYAVAAFTFYKLTLAIYNIFKVKKYEDLYLQNIRNINLASALISIIMLQVAMFQAFSPTSNSSFANALTGAGVSAVILFLGILMIIQANKKLKQLKTNESDKNNRYEDLGIHNEKEN